MSSLNSTESEYRGGKIIVVSIAVAIVQIMVILARFYARKFKKNPFGLDDFLIFVAFVTSLGQSALYIIMVKTGGTGYHLAVVEKHPRKLVNLQKCLYINEIMDMPFTITPAKLSILCFYLRIFFGQRFKFWVSVTGFMILGHGVGVLFAAIFQCSPIAYTWDKAIMDGTCFNQQAFYRYVSIPVIVTDVMIMILPLPFLWKLKVSTSQKIALTGVFILGSMGIVASCLRMSTFFSNSAMVDPTWASVDLGIWTIVEGALLVIAACLPSLWPLFVRIIPGHNTSTRPNRLISAPVPVRNNGANSSHSDECVGFTHFGVAPAQDGRASTAVSRSTQDDHSLSQIEMKVISVKNQLA